MFIERLLAHGFRNLTPLTLDLTPAPVLLVGPNGQGKTNVLEALGVCTTGRSFRNAAPRELIAHDGAKARLEARFSRQGVRHDVSVDVTPGHKAIRIDGRGLREATRLLELVNIVSFFPDDLRIVKGSPEERRRFLDRAIANHRPEFVTAALAYSRAVKSRNALLRAPTPPDRRMVEVYDEQLAQHGEVVHRCRVETLENLTPLAAASFAAIMASAGPLTVELEPGVPAGEGDFATCFREALARAYAKDRARGVTTVGPHRADLALRLGGTDARLFASQGQQRAIVLALKLGELTLLRGRLGSAPILLLDDVSSELDEERTRHFFATATALGSQLWVSSTGAAALPLPPETQAFRVFAGSIERAP